MKQNRIGMRCYVILAVIFSIFLVSGCASTSTMQVAGPEPDPKDVFDGKIERMIDALLSSQRFTSMELAPVAVMPGAARSGKSVTRLEELVMERLTMRLRKTHDIYTLSRQNWFEFREGRPLTFTDRPAGERDYLRNLVVFDARVSSDRTLDKVLISVAGSDSSGRPIPGLVADATLDLKTAALARRLYHEPPLNNPFPEGLEERPYISVDRLAFSLAAELAGAYEQGITSQGQRAADEEVRVMLYARPRSTVSPGLARSLQDAVQQAIVTESGFACVTGERDFEAVLEQMNFYEQNRGRFFVEKSPLAAGTVLLIMEIFSHMDKEKIGVSLRALWQTTPLESKEGTLITRDLAGTYLSGFTARAYLKADPETDWFADGPKRVHKRPEAGDMEIEEVTLDKGFE